MIHSTLTPPVVDQATIDRAIAKAKRERSRAFLSAFRGLISWARPAEPRTAGGHAQAC